MGCKTEGISRVAVIVALWTIVSCAPQAYSPAVRRARARDLAVLMTEKYSSLPCEQADSFAIKAFDSSAAKRDEWKVVLTPWLNNVLVNSGVNKRGLCYHWARDIYRDLAEDMPSGFRMTLIQSYRGEMLREHHAISLHALGEHWSEGIYLDAWRGAGNLKFGLIDRSQVPWQYGAERP